MRGVLAALFFGLAVSRAASSGAVEVEASVTVTEYLSQKNLSSTLFYEINPTTRILGDADVIQSITGTLMEARPGRFRHGYFRPEIYVVLLSVGPNDKKVEEDRLVSMGLPKGIAKHMASSASYQVPCGFYRFDLNEFAYSGYISVLYKNERDLAASVDCLLIGFDYLNGFPVTPNFNLLSFPNNDARLQIMDLVRLCSSVPEPGTRKTSKFNVAAHPSIQCMRDGISSKENSFIKQPL